MTAGEPQQGFVSIPPEAGILAADVAAEIARMRRMLIRAVGHPLARAVLARIEATIINAPPPLQARLRIELGEDIARLKRLMTLAETRPF
jgi:hypothetical protein